MDKKEILRYMRTKSSVNDERLLAMIDSAMAEINSVCEPKSIYRIFDCEVTETALKTGGFEFKSSRLAKNLAGCRRVALLAATVGVKGDMLLRKYSGDGAMLLIMQASLASKIEEVCDSLQAKIEKKEGVKTRQRYSPGYFDLDITEQKKIFKLMDITKRCGITLSDTCQMIPTKSVTAFAGIEPAAEETDEH